MGLIEVDEGDHLMAEEDLTMRVAGIDLAQRDGETAQGLAEAELFSAVAEPALGLDLAHLEAGWLLDGRQAVGKRERTGAIAAGGSSQAQRVVRTHDCTCPIWVTGSLHGKKMRKALGIRNWESAQAIVREWEAGRRAVVVSVKDALALYISDCEMRRLGPETLRKYRLLEREVVEEFGNLPIDGVGVNKLSEYRKKWKLSTGTDRKKIERLRAFFKFNIASKDDFKRTFDSSFDNHWPASSVTPGGNPSSA